MEESSSHRRRNKNRDEDLDRETERRSQRRSHKNETIDEDRRRDVEDDGEDKRRHRKEREVRDGNDRRRHRRSASPRQEEEETKVEEADDDDVDVYKDLYVGGEGDSPIVREFGYDGYSEKKKHSSSENKVTSSSRDVDYHDNQKHDHDDLDDLAPPPVEEVRQFLFFFI